MLAELAARGTPFVGLLYAGLMVSNGRPNVLEFNCRFGDPETQCVLPLLEGDLLTMLVASAAGDFEGVSLQPPTKTTVTVCLTAGGYPEQADFGSPIRGIEEAEAEGALVFHAGTALRDGTLVTNGGRVLNVTGVGESLGEARGRAYAAAAKISFQGMRYRGDIAADA